MTRATVNRNRNGLHMVNKKQVIHKITSDKEEVQTPCFDYTAVYKLIVKLI